MKEQNEHKDNQKKSIAIALVLYLTIVAIMFFIRFWPPYGKTEALIAEGGGGGGAAGSVTAGAAGGSLSGDFYGTGGGGGNFTLGNKTHYFNDFTINASHQMTILAGLTVIYCAGTFTCGGNGIIGTTSSAAMSIGDVMPLVANMVGVS